MSLTSYQAAPPRISRIISISTLCKLKKHSFRKREVKLRSYLCLPQRVTSLKRDQRIHGNWKNSRWHSQLVGSRLCRALVSEKDAGWRAAWVVCAAFRYGRGELDILFRAGPENGGTLVRDDTG